MTDLIPSLALGGDAPRAFDAGAIHLAENPGFGIASVALRRNCPPPTPFGVPLPGTAEFTEAEHGLALWTAQNQWMLLAPGRAEEDFAGAVKVEAPGTSVTEQTDAWAVIEIRSSDGEGPITALLEKLVDLDPATLGPGRVVRTGLAHQSVYVLRRNAAELTVLGMRSAGASLWNALETAAAQLAAVRYS
ncbi:sarcosine oxidase subunit gamma [Poseidonocella pacifica]|uniref:Sarcosine oxidase subunit gamma n=1 Tax=Poseidonocella pacifica TaxID=871651 RepID=A0A1I0Y192_9RHOB|nr:sarcosine oxidase subunit gamma [Poseidonocella pacifica]SFB06944.1 sarcosine oxidase subunit gamma [Poseidonocella pacifica]